MEPDPERRPPPRQLVLGAAFLAWLCAAITLAAVTLGLSDAAQLAWARRIEAPPASTQTLIELGSSLRGWGGVALLGLLALSAVPFAAWPRRLWTTAAYLLGSVAACAAVPLVWWLLEVPLAPGRG